MIHLSQEALQFNKFNCVGQTLAEIFPILQLFQFPDVDKIAQCQMYYQRVHANLCMFMLRKSTYSTTKIFAESENMHRLSVQIR